MLGTLRRKRAVKAIDYARLDVGSDDEDDDDFQPVEVSTKNRKKVKGNSPAKERSKLQPEKRPSVHVADVTEVAAPKPKRLSLEEKLLDRDLKTALRLSQQGCAIADGRESGVPKVQKWEQRADAPEEEVAATVEIETTAVAGLTDVGTAFPGSTALEDDGKQGVEVACQPASDAEEASTLDGSEESPPEPVKKVTAKPRGVQRKSVSGRPEPSVVPGRTLPNGGKTSVIWSAAKTSASMPKATVPIPSARKSTMDSPNVPRASIRLGLSRRHVGKPLHRVVKVEL